MESLDDEDLQKARMEIAIELPSGGREKSHNQFETSWEGLHDSSSRLPGLTIYEDDEADERRVIVDAFDKVQNTISEDAERGNKLEKKLALHLGGYQQRAKTLRQKIVDASEALEEETIKLDSLRTLQIAEEAALPRRLESLQEEVRFVQKREREAQDMYRLRMQELDGLTNGNGAVNGDH